MKDDAFYLVHILECVAYISEYTKDGRETFMTSTLIQHAVLRNLQTLAESSQRISEPVKSAHPEIDWRRMAGFRNVLVHDYLSVDLEIVWNVIEKFLPDLQTHVKVILDDLQGKDKPT